ncbi:protein kinase domain-containing protein, partial [Aquipuribacter hungaricus]|uniref:protein kinase domain-containing protein n=1 Tax=Aquipuribacter hungaricus TaxID=545624 RepID=UPI0030EEB36A
MAGRRSTGVAQDDGPREGDEVAGVVLGSPVGSGGSGSVWAGTDVATGERVAVKLLHRRPGAGPSAAGGTAAGARAGGGNAAGEAGAVEDAGWLLAREGALLGGLRHPHVLAVRRVCSDPPALVTDLASGGSLAAQVAARGTLTPGEVVTVVAPLADALAALHARGVVHGDVTAANVLFVDRGRPVLADLGVARLAGSGTAWATPGFAAPEVLAGAAPGPAADVHGLGAAAWLALTGAVPPVEEDRLPLGLLAPSCPSRLTAAVTAALDPDPAARPAPEELAAAARATCPGTAVRLVPSAAL